MFCYAAASDEIVVSFSNALNLPFGDPAHPAVSSLRMVTAFNVTTAFGAHARANHSSYSVST